MCVASVLQQVMLPLLLMFLLRPLIYWPLVPAPESRLLFRRLAAEQAEKVDLLSSNLIKFDVSKHAAAG